MARPYAASDHVPGAQAILWTLDTELSTNVRKSIHAALDVVI